MWVRPCVRGACSLYMIDGLNQHPTQARTHTPTASQPASQPARTPCVEASHVCCAHYRSISHNGAVFLSIRRAYNKPPKVGSLSLVSAAPRGTTAQSEAECLGALQTCHWFVSSADVSCPAPGSSLLGCHSSLLHSRQPVGSAWCLISNLRSVHTCLDGAPVCALCLSDSFIQGLAFIQFRCCMSDESANMKALAMFLPCSSCQCAHACNLCHPVLAPHAPSRLALASLLLGRHGESHLGHPEL